jgi:tetratricopeptide (TPR) repeat protein
VLLSTNVSSRQARWYDLYDEALQHVQRKDWQQAEQKLVGAKKAGPAPGRRVLRFGNFRPPFLPDYYLAQVYAALAASQTTDDAKREYYKRALDAIAVAEAGQVDKGNQAELKTVQDIQLAAKNALASGVVVTDDNPKITDAKITDSKITDAPKPPVDALASSRRDIQGLVDQGEKLLAGAAWDRAVDAWQQVNTRLAEAPSLRSEFTQAPARLREATLARDIASALQLLQSGRYRAALDALERAQPPAAGAAISTDAVRAFASALPTRIQEAEASLALTTAEEAFRNRQWAAAARGFEEASRLATGVTFSSPQAKELAARAPARITEANLNTAIAEKRFADALAIDRNNRTALDGQYVRALDAYNLANWQVAAADFALLVKYAPGYRDAADRNLAADIQVTYRLGIEAEQAGNTALARQHFDTLVALQRKINGPLATSSAVVETVEGATNRVRRMTARAGLATARRQYQNGEWDEARNSVNLVLGVTPDDNDATELLRLLNDIPKGQEVQRLIRTAKEALARDDLDQAATAATLLQRDFPQNQEAAFVLGEVSRIRSERGRRYQMFAIAAGVMSIGPLLLVSSRNRGRFFGAIGRPTAALRVYGNVLAANPNDAMTLTRAASLAIRYRVSAPLGPHFERYLKARPEDAELTTVAADYFWHQGEKERAAALYERVVTTTTATLPPIALQRLREFYPTQLPPAVVAALERARRDHGSRPELIALLAAQYSAAARVDAEALDVYKEACAHEPENARWRLSLAKALSAAENWDAAATEAGEAARRDPDGDVLDVLADAMSRKVGDEPASAAQRLAALKLPAGAMLVVAERLIDAQPALRASFRPLYEQEARGATEPTLAAVLQVHARLDDRDVAGARQALVTDVNDPAVAGTRLRALVDVHRRYLTEAAAQGGPTDADVVARVAQLYAAARDWEKSVRAWQSIVSVPEWNRRSMTAIQDVLDGLQPVEIARAYFATSDWRVEVEAAGAEGAIGRCRITPGPAAGAELRAQFTDTPVFCYSSLVTVDDLVHLKRDVLARPRPSENAIAFLIATQAVRHDVYALIYAFMTEDPAVTVIPLEAQAIREAIIEARSHTHLERTLHQWLGHTDIYETHNPVADAATFFGRGHFINRLVLKISRGENFGIFGLRKVGKTSLVYRLRELSRDHLVSYVDLQGIASRRTSEVYLRLIESLARNMRVKYPEVPLPPLRLNDTTVAEADVAERFHADVLALRRALEGGVGSPPNVLLLLDEIELMVPQANSPGFEGHQDFFRHIRGLFQQERFIVSAVVGATPTVCRVAKWGARDNPVFQFYDEVFLAMLDRVECDQMVQGLGELMGVRFDQSSLDLVFEQTAGHPYVTRQLCSRLVRSFPDRPLQVTRDMVVASIDDYLAQRGDYFAGLVEGYLDDAARRVVEAIALADEEGDSRADLVKALAAKAAPHVVDRVLGDLELVELVLRAGERYTLRSPLFRRWLRRSWLGVE